MGYITCILLQILQQPSQTQCPKFLPELYKHEKTILVAVVPKTICNRLSPARAAIEKWSDDMHGPCTPGSGQPKSSSPGFHIKMHEARDVELCI